MGKISKTFAVFLTVIIAISCLTLLTVKPANAQTIPKPSIPEFTLKYVDHSYDVPPTTTTTIDPYTGKQTTTTISGYHVQNKTVDVIIENQPFTPNKDANGNYTNLFYNIRYKPHYTSEWWYYYEYNPYASFPTQHYIKADLSRLNTTVSLPHREDISFPQNGCGV